MWGGKRASIQLHAKQGEATIGHYAVRLWNRLLLDIKAVSTVCTFKTKLNTKLFIDAFN